jgi:UDP:flavonoid glycosyltransferase YjiC (YdhE family)
MMRSEGISFVAYGAGHELRSLSDTRLSSPRFSGWASWQRVFTSYVGATLEHDIVDITRHLRQYQPDVVVTSTFTTAGRVAALRENLPFVDTTVYSRLWRRRFGPGFAGQLRRSLVDNVPGVSAALAASLALGEPELLLADPRVCGYGDASDFPYWDDLSAHAGEGDRVKEWLELSTNPVVLITVGTLGQMNHRLSSALQSETLSHVRFLLAGRSSIAVEDSERFLRVPYIALSKALPRCSAIVHHGGLGTVMGSIRSGCPAMVLPQGFDQFDNAAAVERAGLGVSPRPEDDLAALLLLLLRNNPMRVNLSRWSSGTCPSLEIASSLVAKILDISAYKRR